MAEFDFINDPGFTERPDPLMERFVPKSKEDFPTIPGFGAGKEVLSQMQGAGYSSAEMQDFVTTSARMTLSEGGTPQDVDTFFGVKPFDPAPIREETEKALTRTLARHPEEKNPQRIYELYWQELWTETDEMLAEGSRSWDEIQAGIEAIPQTIEDVKLGLKAGHQSAAIGMALRGGMPDTFLPENANRAMRLGASFGNYGTDAPLYALGALFGTGSGSVTGPLAPVMGTAGAFALPAWMRGRLIDKYTNGEIKDFDEFIRRTTPIATQTFNQWLVGAGVGATGQIATVGFGTAALHPFIALETEATAMAVLGASAEGHVPTLQDIEDANLFLLGAKVAVTVPARARAHATRKIQEAFIASGKTPREILEAANVDQSVIQDIMSVNKPVPDVYRGISLNHARHRIVADIRALGAEPDPALLTPDLGLKPRPRTGDAEPVKPEPAKPTEAPSAEADRADFSLEAVAAELKADIAAGRVAAPEATPEAPPEPAPPTRTRRRYPSPEELTDPAQRQRAMELEEHLNFINATEVAKEEFAVRAEEARVAEEARKSQREMEREDAAREKQLSKMTPEEQDTSTALEMVAINVKKNILKRFYEKYDVVREDGFHDLYTDWLTDLHPYGRIMQRFADGKILPTKDDFVKLARMLPGSGGISHRFLEDMTLDQKTRQPLHLGLRDILMSPAVRESIRAGMNPKTTHQDPFRVYILADRLLELEANGIDTGMGPRRLEAFKRIRDNPKMQEKYDEARLALIQFQTDVMAWARDAGLVSAESFELMMEASQNYMPLHRLVDGPQRGDPLKRMHGGSDKMLIDPLESIIKNTYTLLRRAENNYVKVKLIEFIEAHPESGDQIGHKVERKLRAIKLDAREKRKAIQKASGRVGVELTKEEMAFLKEEFAIFRPERIIKGENQVIIRRKGKPELWELDPEISRTIEHMDGFDIDTWVGMMGAPSALLTGPASLLRAGAVLSPEFMVRNPFKDTFVAYLTSENGFRLFIDSTWGMWQVAGKTEEYRTWTSSGAMMADLQVMDSFMARLALHDVTRSDKIAARTLNAVVHPIEALRYTSRLFEEATRVGDFGRGTGLSPDNAFKALFGYKGKRKPSDLSREEILEHGFRSREVTQDFARMGAKMRGLNQIVAFLGARVGGEDKLIRNMLDNPQRLSGRLMKSVIIPTMLLTLYNRNDREGYNNIPEWQRMIFWVVPVTVPSSIRELARDQGLVIEEKVWLRFPKPFSYGIILAGLTERAVNYILDQDEHAFDDFLAKEGMSLMPGDVIPTTMVPMVEHAANKSMLTNKPLVPSYVEGLVPEMRYTPYTSPIAKMVGDLIGRAPIPGSENFAAPIIVENYVKRWTGGLGQYVMQATSQALIQSGVAPPQQETPFILADIPGLKGFLIRWPMITTDPTAKFWTEWRKIEMERKSLEALREDMILNGLDTPLDVQDKIELQFKIRHPDSEIQGLDWYKDTISGYGKEIRAINLMPNTLMSPVERLQQMEDMAIQMTETAILANEYIAEEREYHEELRDEYIDELRGLQ